MHIESFGEGWIGLWLHLSRKLQSIRIVMEIVNFKKFFLLFTSL